MQLESDPVAFEHDLESSEKNHERKGRWAAGYTNTPLKLTSKHQISLKFH